MTGMCGDCKLGEHENCKMLMPTNSNEIMFCGCKCSGQGLGTSPESMPKVPNKIRKEFPEFPAPQL